MYLKQRLKSIADYSNKKTYEEITEVLLEIAKKEKYEAYISGSEVYESDISKLEYEEGLDIEFLEGEEYGSDGCWKISWD